MSRYHSYINTATEILQQYKGEEPLASFLKKFFSKHKKYGSKDRKQISHLCYCYFRIGRLKTNQPIEERLLLALFLCSGGQNEILQQLRPEWMEVVHLSSLEKLLFLGLSSFQDIFPFPGELSSDILKESFSLSHLTQPDLFLRLRPGREKAVKEKLT
ncbi:MAG: Fmu (Sun) domain-containing protein, partial [Chitinophagaceae bacterium]|nr:Fmu (Sun) domain-containing protein [Chitinophagaceae bacterium]